MIRKHLKFIYIGTLLLLTTVAFFLLIRAEKPTSVKPNTPAEFAQNEQQISKFCKEAGAVEYYYYKTIPQDQRTNNKFGIYVYAEVNDFFKLADELVNSKGGDWGYVLIPYNIKDRDREKWNRVFNQLEAKHLIPIIQLWDVNPEDYKTDTKDAAKFLSQFVWPIRQRYISAYNEPNDAKFWKGKVDPGNYARVLEYTIKAFKDESTDYFMINGALNVSADHSGDYMDAFLYMEQMESEVPGIFNKLDGWASHPYPQPNFSGSPYAAGRWSIRAYETELEQLKKLGVKKDLPVFITETGWAHAEGESYNSSYVDAQKAAENFEIAFKEFWLKDERVVAVTPFTIRYDAPFDHFSWVNQDNVPYKQYDVVKSMTKVKGNPESLEKAEVKQVGCF